MPEYRCECCNYTTNKKSTFDTHNVSKKHLEKMNTSSDDVKSEKSINMETIYSQESNVSSESYLTLKIRELENALKLKDLEIKMKDEQIELLKNTIQVLSQPKPVEEPKLFSQKIVSKQKTNTDNINMEVEEIKNELNKKATTKEQTLINIEAFFETYIKNSQETKYTYKFTTDSVKFTALKPLYYRVEYSNINIMKATLEIIFDAIKKLPKNETFYICKDINRRKFDIKSKGEIIKSNKSEEIDEIITWLFKSTYNFLFNSFNTFNTYFQKRYTYFDEYQLNMIKTAEKKRDYENLPLTEVEQKLIMLNSQNSKVKNEFENITGINYDIFKSSEGWSSELGRTFFTFGEEQFKKGFSHLRTLLATNKLNEKELNKEQPPKEDNSDEEEEKYESDNE